MKTFFEEFTAALAALVMLSLLYALILIFN